MGVIQVTDELQGMIERQVAEGRAVTSAAFLENAVRHLVEATDAEEEAMRLVVDAGAADIDAGRFVTVIGEEDRRRLQDDATARLRARLSADE